MKRKKQYPLLIALWCFVQSITAASHQQCQMMEEMVARLAPAYVNRFKFELTTDCIERFMVRSEADKIVISGNSAIAMAVGLNHYLKNYCLTEVSWKQQNPVILPRLLPHLSQPITGKAKVKNRFFLNYCTFGYTMPWWGWKEWERLIDWMALNGVTMPLAITGVEAAWQRVWQREGLTDEQIRSFFTGPAHLPWQRMVNVNGWQGPLPQAWIDGQLLLQQRILQRERAFGMRPVLSAFNGSVPLTYKQRHPKAQISEVSQWGGFAQQYRTYFLSPTDPLFTKLQKAFLEEQTRLFGSDHLYCLDSFNEVQPPSWDLTTLRALPQKLYQSLAAVDPEAVWIQMGWFFYNDQKHWTPETMRAFLSGIPKGRMYLLDYYIDHTEIWKLTERFYGQSYLTCVLANFGGNTMLQGDINKVSRRLDDAISQGGDNMIGLGATMEGFGVNPDFYEFVLDKAWDCGQTAEEWKNRMADRHVGFACNENRKVWQLLFNDIMPSYVNESGTVVCARPSFEARYLNTTYPERLLQVWKSLLDINSNKREHLYDVINVGRQVLGDFFAHERDSLYKAYKAQHMDAVNYYAARMEGMLDDLDELLACDKEFSLYKWIEDARGFGQSEAEKDYYERNARTLITVWGDSRQLTDYANRTWAGLVSSYYKKRWQLFIQHVKAAVLHKRAFDSEACNKEIEAFERRWIEPTITRITYPTGRKDIKQLARDIYNKWFTPKVGLPKHHATRTDNSAVK